MGSWQRSRRLPSVRNSAPLTITTSVLVFVALWEIATRVGLVDSIIVSTPHQVVSAIPDILSSDAGRQALRTTGYEILVAFCLAVVTGSFVGTLLGISRGLRKAYLPLVTFVLGTPKVIFLPIFMTFLGISERLAIAFGAFEAFFYIVVNVEGGVEAIDRRHLKAAHAFQAPRYATLVHVIWPSAAPSIFTGLWFGLKHSFLGVLVAELFASRTGVGTLVKTYSEALDTAKVMGIVLVVASAAIMVGSVWSWLERRLGRWRYSARGTITSMSSI